MEQSLYVEQVKTYFPGVAARVIERLNDTTNKAAITYLHRSMLRKEYSPDLKWNSASISQNIVAADVISMDSSIPLKKRDSLGQANGDIPKVGMELALREKELTELGIIARKPGQANELLRRLFQDTPRVIQGVYEIQEYMFLLGLSSGVTVVSDTNNVGSGIRLDYGYLTANKFGVPVIWSNTASTPLNDISTRIMTKASTDGNRVTKLMMDLTTFTNIAKTTEVKDMYSLQAGYAGSVRAIPTLTQFNAMTQERYGWTVEIVDRAVKFEKNGVKTVLKPWVAGSVVALTSDQVGRLVYGTLAEMEHPVESVNYTTVDDYILVSKFRLNRPSLAEFTNSQAMAIPVIDGTDAIYLMDSTTVQP